MLSPTFLMARSSRVRMPAPAQGGTPAGELQGCEHTPHVKYSNVSGPGLIRLSLYCAFPLTVPSFCFS